VDATGGRMLKWEMGRGWRLEGVVSLVSWVGEGIGDERGLRDRGGGKGLGDRGEV
jgi:hypothetical protein